MYLFLTFKNPRKLYLIFLSIEMLLHLGIPNNQILLHFSVPDNQILIRLGVPNNQILLHFGVPNSWSMNISFQPCLGTREVVGDTQME